MPGLKNLGMGHISIRNKLLGGFGLVLLFTATIGIVSYQTIDYKSREYQELIELNALSEMMANARIAEKNFVLRGGNQHISENQGYTGQLRRQVTGLAGRADTDAERSVMNQIVAEVDDYRQLFD
ncbi:MAG: hypothetical protein ACX931_02580 [Saccharospirillum sp.]